MTFCIFLLAVALLAAPAMAEPAASSALETTDGPRALEPFVAQYQVFKDGRVLGDAVMRVVKNDARRWRVDLDIKGTEGLVGLAGIAAQQSTVFDMAGNQYRPLAQSTVRKTVFTKKQTVGIYDWRSHQARWTGDVKESRRAPVTLQSGDQSGLLINLAVIRDAQPGQSLQYRIGELSYSAMRVTRAQAGNEETVIWVVDGVPTPVRLLQREDGEDKYDLRLVEYKGAQ